MTDLARQSRLALAIQCLEAAAKWGDERYMEFEERAATLEHVEGMSKTEAEIKAFFEMRAQKKGAEAPSD